MFAVSHSRRCTRVRLYDGIVTMPCKVSKDKFQDIVREAIAELPERFAKALQTVRIEVRQRPTPWMMRNMRIGSDEVMLGLYDGRPITRRSVEESAVMPEVIYLFKQEIEAVCQTTDEVRREVRATVLHELGHHFGLDEKNLDDLGYG